ncbi:MAG: DUF3575 domain-containing protein [Proteobacteria bacterium]|nr:DUF3575 domain-containing protein [Pseudomonadota bacterium]
MNFKSLLGAVLLMGCASPLFAKEGDRYNIRVAPISVLAQVWNLESDFKVSDQFTLGPSVAYYIHKASGVQTSAYVLGARANWFPVNGVFNSGFYIGPSLSYIGVSAQQDKVEASLSVWQLTAVGGYHWFWDSGFNLNLGAGGSYQNWPDYVTVNGKKISLETYENMSLAIEFTLGWSF